MAFEADLGQRGERYRVRTAEERERAFQRAERHSRLVAMLRKGLPILALVVLASYFVSTRLSVTVGDVTASISGFDVSDGNLRMVNPTLKGADKSNGKYVLTADHADQDIKNPKVIKLHAIKAEMDNPSGGWSRMEATRGVFDSKAERLVMQDRITVATSSGITGELKHATLDMGSQTLRSHRPVVFNLPNGKVTANALTLRSSASELTFRGKVHVHLVKPPKEEDAKKTASPQPQAEPSPRPTVEAAPSAPGAAKVTTGALPQESSLPPLPPMPE